MNHVCVSANLTVKGDLLSKKEKGSEPMLHEEKIFRQHTKAKVKEENFSRIGEVKEKVNSGQIF